MHTCVPVKTSYFVLYFYELATVCILSCTYIYDKSQQFVQI